MTKITKTDAEIYGDLFEIMSRYQKTANDWHNGNTANRQKRRGDQSTKSMARVHQKKRKAASRKARRQRRQMQKR